MSGSATCCFIDPTGCFIKQANLVGDISCLTNLLKRRMQPIITNLESSTRSEGP